MVLGFYPCGPVRLNISQKKDKKNKINVNCVSHTVVENLKQFAFKADKSRVVRRTFWLIKVVPTWKKVWETLSQTNGGPWQILYTSWTHNEKGLSVRQTKRFAFVHLGVPKSSLEVCTKTWCPIVFVRTWSLQHVPSGMFWHVTLQWTWPTVTSGPHPPLLNAHGGREDTVLGVRENGHSLARSAKVKDEWNCTSTAPISNRILILIN
jgi:hypothetical protein